MSNLQYYRGFGENLKKLRNRKKLTQKELADKLGISDKSISLIETEEREPTIEQINAYREYFSVSLEYLTGKTHAVNPMTKERYGEILKRTQSALSDLWAESKSFTASERIQLLKLKFELNKELYEFAKEQADENNQL